MTLSAEARRGVRMTLTAKPRGFVRTTLSAEAKRGVRMTLTAKPRGFAGMNMSVRISATEKEKPAQEQKRITAVSAVPGKTGTEKEATADGMIKKPVLKEDISES